MAFSIKNTRFYFDITPGAYQFAVSFDSFYVDGQRGKATFLSNFDTRRSDRNPPTIKKLAFYSNGWLSGATMDQSATNELKAIFQDDHEMDSVKIYYRAMGGSNWHELALSTGDSGEVRASLNDIPITGFVDLKLEARDQEGNSLSCQYSPGLEIKFEAPMAGIRIKDFKIVKEEGGRADGAPNPGERIFLKLTMENSSFNSLKNVRAIPFSDDPYISSVACKDGKIGRAHV